MPLISENTASSNELVAAVSGKKIRVTSYTLVSAGAVDATFEDGDGTDLAGTFTMITGTPVTAYDPRGLFETPAGKSLNLLLGSGVLVAGHFNYELIEP